MLLKGASAGLPSDEPVRTSITAVLETIVEHELPRALFVHEEVVGVCGLVGR